MLILAVKVNEMIKFYQKDCEDITLKVISRSMDKVELNFLSTKYFLVDKYPYYNKLFTLGVGQNIIISTDNRKKINITLIKNDKETKLGFEADQSVGIRRLLNAT